MFTFREQRVIVNNILAANLSNGHYRAQKTTTFDSCNAQMAGKGKAAKAASVVNVI